MDNQNDLYFRINSDGGIAGRNTFEYPANFQKNMWYHVAVTYDGSNIRMYVNGTNVKTDPYSDGLFVSTENVYIGAKDSTSPGLFFNGSISDLMIWNRSLSTSEIEDIYNGIYPLDNLVFEQPLMYKLSLELNLIG